MVAEAATPSARPHEYAPVLLSFLRGGGGVLDKLAWQLSMGKVASRRGSKERQGQQEEGQNRPHFKLNGSHFAK